MMGLWRHLLAVVFAASFASGARRLPKLSDDTTCLTAERQWYKPEYHASDLKNFIEATARSTEQIYDCLDMFGASGRVAQTWVDAGFSAIGFDVKIDGAHDITSEGGVKTLVKMAIQLKDNGIMICAPPCSMFGPACSSVHQRTIDKPEGNQRVFKVRLAQRIWKNFAHCVRMVLEFRPSLGVLIEQPSGSWGLKQPFVIAVTAMFNMWVVMTWMGLFGHDIPKCSHLATNLRSMNALARTLHKADREHIKRRFRRRQQNRTTKRVYHVRKTSKEGKRQWCGGKDLALSATFTWSFCEALLCAWKRHKTEIDEANRAPVDAGAVEPQNVPILIESDTEPEH